MHEKNVRVEERKGEDEKDYNFIQGKILAHPPPGEEIVISGLSGTFPSSKDVYHFQENLFNKVNMVTPNERWEYIHPEVPQCSGIIPECSKYDAGFFGTHTLQAIAQDTMGRILLEKSVEAIFDAGLNLSDIEGTNTGVYLGACFSESEQTVDQTVAAYHPRYKFIGCSRSSLAHRISYCLKLKGPSLISDTACSSSLFALDNAFRDLRLGLVDMAIVGGAGMCFHPFVSLQFARLGVLSLDSSCKVFDKAGNGYARSEAIGVLLLQRGKDAKRNYSEIVYVKTNCDGFKEAGITYPSGEAQCRLLTEFYNEAGIHPDSLSFLEAHGTGTVVGDPEECSAIDAALAKPRTTPLLIGSVKSNIGHTEPASGICSITKCIIGMETGYIPPNIHYSEPRENILGIVGGRMKVVTEKTPLVDPNGLIGINSFGFGGGNCHVLLRRHGKDKINNGLPDDDIPRVVCISGRTEDAITTLLDELKNSSFDAERIRLLHDVFRKNTNNHVYRAYSILSKDGEVCRSSKLFPAKKTPLYFAFGELSHWYQIGKDLMVVPTFLATIQKAQKLLLPKGMNVMETVFGKNENKTKYQVLGSILVQTGLADIFRTLEIHPTNFFGRSFGELLAAYFDGILTLKQIVGCAFALNDTVDRINEKNGKSKETKKYINDESDGNLMGNFRTASSSTVRKGLLTDLINILDEPKIQNSGKYMKKFGSAEYFLNSFANNVSPKLEFVESNSIVLSFDAASTSVKIPENVEVIPLAPSKESNSLVGFLKILGYLYINGYNPQLSKFYPEVQFPVSRGTRMISPFIRWNHDRDWFTPSYNLQVTNSVQQGARQISISVDDQEWSSILGHVIDGRNLFPATGYLYLVWETLALIEDVPMTIKHVVFEDVKFLRATTLPKKGHVTFSITINRFSGKFEVCEGDSSVVVGKIFSRDSKQIEEFKISQALEDEMSMNTKDIYKELRLRGYNYSGSFRSIVKCNQTATIGFIKWTDNWISFMDNMLQLRILQLDSRLLYVPTYIAQLTVNAEDHLEWINKNYLTKESEPHLPVYCNDYTGEIRCKNLVIRGLKASSISRKKDFRVPVVESYTFIPNNTDLDLEESIRVNMQIFLENSLVKKVKVIELIDDFTKVDSIVINLIQAAFEDQPLIQPLVKILTKRTIETNIPIEDKDLCNERDCNIIVGSELLSRPKILETSCASLKDNGFLISRESIDFDGSNLGTPDFTIFTVHKTPSEIIVLLKKNSKTRELITINVEDTGSFPWVETVRDVIKLRKSDNLVLFAQNDSTSGVLGLVNCLRREPESQFVRCLLILDPAEDFDKEKPFYKEQLQKNMAINIWKDGTWGTYRHLLLHDLDKVESEHCLAYAAVRGDLSSMTWFESSLRSGMIVPPEKKLVRVHYSSLNFRDIMTASGKINADVITQNRLEQECVQGFEFSGMDQEGNRVMGMITHGALSSLILADKYTLFDVPDSMTLEQAATVPVVYGTIIYGMQIRGGLKRNESILIHSGTGGVGQAAIRMALYYDCEIFVTVGTQAKKEYLLKTFPQLKESNIGNSHDLSFEKMVMGGTKGRGVDMVLNSLAEEKLLASARCLAYKGRFIEIGKFDLASNNDLSLLLLRKEASFHGITLDGLLYSTPRDVSEVSDILRDNIGKYVVPLPTSVFGYNEIEEAFRYMSTGKHMGKVMIKIRDEEANPRATIRKFSGYPSYSGNLDKTYIILGGLGGFGLELADWLVLKGVKNLVLSSRKGITTGYQKMRVKLWQSYGVQIQISKDDICTEEGCRNMLENANKMGEVYAIFNLAVVLADAVFENQTDVTFKTSFGPKAIATAHLDKLSRELCPNLKDFVIFSSVTCGRGNAGQTNYGMSNSVMERICEKRRKEGYPALAIQWGAVGDVGLVAELQEEHVELEIGGTLQQRISSCISVLNKLLRQNEATIVSSIVVAEKKGGLDSCDSVVDVVVSILGLNDASPHASLPELGMDSMTGVEIKQTLEREFEIFLTPKEMKSMTLTKLKEIQEKKFFTTEDREIEDTFSMIVDQLGDEEEIKLIDIHMNPELKTEASTPSILLIPGIEGFAKKFNTFVTHLGAPAIGLQLCGKTSPQTVQEMAQLLLPVVERHIKPNEHFNIVVYSFGSLVGLEIVHLLETKGHVGNVAIVDGGVALMKKLASQWYQESDTLFEMMLIGHLMSYYLPSEGISAQQEKLLKCNNWEERLEVALQVIKQVNDANGDHQKTIANGIYYRLKAIKSYTPSYEKLRSKIKLYKPSESIVRDIEEDYELSKISESPVEVEVFEGNHGNILNNTEVAQSINSFFQDLRFKEYI